MPLYATKDSLDGVIALLRGEMQNISGNANAVLKTAQTLSTAEQLQVKQNVGVGLTIAGARLATDPVLSDAQALAQYGEGAYFTVDQT
jgi:hypothetical protein